MLCYPTSKFFGKRCFLIICAFLPLVINADTSISITSGRGAPFVKPDQSGFYDLIVINMFKRAGLRAKTVLLPSERSLINANTGIDDGNIARIKGLEKKYPNLVMVPGKVIDFDFVVFTKSKNFKVKDWRSLKPYNIAFINGWKYFEKKARYYKSLTRVKSSTQLFNLLNNNRADIALYDLWSGLWWLRRNTADIHFLLPPIASVKLYLYVNKKYKKLVPMLSRALAEMKKDGTYKLIYDKTLSRLLK